MRIRIKQAKVKEMSFLSHLDMLTTINRALRRSGLPFAITEGFNPKPKIAYGMPLGVGVMSLCEYYDLFFKTDLDEWEVISKLKPNFPPSLHLFQAKRIEKNEPSLMGQIEGCEYLVNQNQNQLKPYQYEEIYQRIISEQKLISLKKLIVNSEKVVINFVAKAGSKENLSPKEFPTWLFDLPREQYCLIIRKELFIKKDNQYKTPFGMEVQLA